MTTSDPPTNKSPYRLQIEKRGLIFDATRASVSDAVAYVTSLLPLSSGTVLAGWQSGPEKHNATNTIRLARSYDGGLTWDQVAHRFEQSWQGVSGSFMGSEMVETTDGTVLLFATWVDRRDPERPLFDPETEGILPTRLLCCVSTDEGDTWTGFKEVPTAGLTGCAVTGPAVRWSDGTIACAFESFKEFDDPTPVQPAAWACVSRDEGRTFSEPRLIARHPEQAKYYWDQRLCPTTEPGEYIAMFWTHARVDQRDLNVHLLRGSLLEPTQADEQPVPTTIPGQIAAPWVSSDGRMLAFVVDRGRPGTLTLWQSVDDGHTWPTEDRLVVHVHDEQASITQGRENIDYAEYWEDMGKWSFGHPAIRQIGDGWLLAWYAGTPDRMSLHWARVMSHREPIV